MARIALTADTNPGTASWTSYSGAVFATASITFDAQTENIPVLGIQATDIVLATVVSDDTGGSLGGIAEAKANAIAGRAEVTVNNAPANNDGVVSIVVIRPA